jgi:hypothetical protein
MQMDGFAGLVVFDFVDAPMGQGERALMSRTVSLAGDGNKLPLRQRLLKEATQRT